MPFMAHLSQFFKMVANSMILFIGLGLCITRYFFKVTLRAANKKYIIFSRCKLFSVCVSVCLCTENNIFSSVRNLSVSVLSKCKND